jgi:hypothetical protein
VCYDRDGCEDAVRAASHEERGEVVDEYLAELGLLRVVWEPVEAGKRSIAVPHHPLVSRPAHVPALLQILQRRKLFETRNRHFRIHISQFSQRVMACVAEEVRTELAKIAFR